jgi:heme-degrading monooxygenase HmoA
MTYTYIWEYQVRPDQEPAFRRDYGPDGAWVRLFRQSPGYVSTQLYRDRADPLRYLTVDTWESEAAHLEFRSRFADAFASLDEACEAYTLRETPLGRFDPVGDE